MDRRRCGHVPLSQAGGGIVRIPRCAILDFELQGSFGAKGAPQDDRAFPECAGEGARATHTK
jgi:hypothetical protein